jgi:hypothetical protein
MGIQGAIGRIVGGAQKGAGGLVGGLYNGISGVIGGVQDGIGGAFHELSWEEFWSAKEAAGKEFQSKYAKSFLDEANKYMEETGAGKQEAARYADLKLRDSYDYTVNVSPFWPRACRSPRKRRRLPRRRRSPRSR